MQALPAQPESLCIVEMGGVEKQDELGEKGTIGFLYLNIGLQVMSLPFCFMSFCTALYITLSPGNFIEQFFLCDLYCYDLYWISHHVCVCQNGVLLRTVLDPVTGDLSDTRTRYLGSRPVKLFRVRMQGQEAVSGHAYLGAVPDSYWHVTFVREGLRYVSCCLTSSGVGHVQPIMAELLIPVTFPSHATFVWNSGVCFRVCFRAVSWRHCGHLYQHIEVMSTLSSKCMLKTYSRPIWYSVCRENVGF